jgi:hypothetical protein
MGRDKGGFGQDALPLLADFNEIIPVRAIAMQEDDELLSFAAARIEAWSVNGGGQIISPADGLR